MRTRDTFFYVITDSNYYKVGIAFDPAERLSTLQTGNPYPLRLVYRKRFTLREEAKAFESEVIKHLVAKGRETDGGTEWFTFEPGDLTYIRRGMRPGRSIAGHILYFIVHSIPNWIYAKRTGYTPEGVATNRRWRRFRGA